jgi:hypothetical protein
MRVLLFAIFFVDVQWCVILVCLSFVRLCHALSRPFRRLCHLNRNRHQSVLTSSLRALSTRVVKNVSSASCASYCTTAIRRHSFLHTSRSNTQKDVVPRCGPRSVSLFEMNVCDTSSTLLPESCALHATLCCLAIREHRCDNTFAFANSTTLHCKTLTAL